MVWHQAHDGRRLPMMITCCNKKSNERIQICRKHGGVGCPCEGQNADDKSTGQELGDCPPFTVRLEEVWEANPRPGTQSDHHNFEALVGFSSLGLLGVKKILSSCHGIAPESLEGDVGRA